MVSDVPTPEASGGDGASRGGVLRRYWPSGRVLRERAPLVAPLLVVGLATSASMAAMTPLVRTAYAGHPELLPTVAFGVWLLALLSPFTTLVKCTVLGGAAWAVLALVGAEARFRSAVSVLAYAQIILVAQAAWVVALLWMRGRASLGAPEDLVMATGLDALVDDPTSPLAALAHGIGPFEIVWVAAVAIGLAAIAGVSRRRAAVAAVTVWGLGLAVAVVRAWL